MATATLTRWLFPYIFFMGTAALGMAALHAKPIQRFGHWHNGCRLCGAPAPAIAIIDGKRNAQSATAIRASQHIAESFVAVLPT